MSQAFSTRVWGKSPAFWQGSVSPGTHPASWLAPLPAAAAAPGGDVRLLAGTVPAAGMLARCWPAPECPWGSDVQDNLKSLSLCGLAPCRPFCPWLFWEHGGAAHVPGLGHSGHLPGAAPGGAPGTAAGDEPCGSGRGYSHPASRCGLPTSDTFPVSGAALHPCRDCIHPSRADWEPAEQTQRVGDMGGDEEGAAILPPCSEEELQMGL